MAKQPAAALYAVDVEGVTDDPALRGRFARRVRQTLARLGVVPMSVRMDFADQNGPKGGVSVRCAMTVRLPRRPSARIEHMAETPLTAFDGAIDTLERRLAQNRRRDRDSSRRPKKYYAAKRALAGGKREPGRAE